MLKFAYGIIRSKSIIIGASFINSFTGKTAFITGGASGIGLGMAKAYAERGMNLALADISENELLKAKQGFLKQGIDILTLTLDVADRDAVKSAAKQVVDTFGAVHIVSANAGVSGHMGPLQEGKDADWDWVIDVNLKGSINTVQAFLPYLIQNQDSSHITITSSISGLRVFQPSRGQGMYNTTKFALVGYGEALSIDLKDENIGVSILCPGIVNTDISNSGRNRSEKYGGAFAMNEDHDLAKASKSGTDPLQFGHWVIKAIETNMLYVITHPDDRALVEARHNKILSAFDESTNLTK